ncbi:hypothetical protein [Streptomyces sp. NPDC048825]|uniref:hypothetical protein n=1 Tax=Streptomyces sp. NPDC048825 TaxID=3365592 RepID=UPI00371B537C
MTACRDRRAQPRKNRARRQLSRTALAGFVRGAAGTLGALAVGALAAWLRDHL